MQPESYILFDSCATLNPQIAKSGFSRQIKQAAIHLLEAQRLLLAVRPLVLRRGTKLMLESLGAASRRLVVVVAGLEEEL
jgi:hypothetical protein